MWGESCIRSIVGLPHLKSDHFPHRSQVANTDSINGANKSNQKASCDECLEENKKMCKCDHGIDHRDEKYSMGAHETQIEPLEKANSSTMDCTINMTGMLIGLGQLSTPYALENGGWASSFLLVGLGIMCAYTCCLLGKCLDRNPKSRNYADIGHEAFGLKGKIISSIFIYMGIFMTLVSYTISLHDNLITVFPGTTLHLKVCGMSLSTSQLLAMIAVLVALPSLWLRNLSSISFLSTCGILLSVVIFSSVAATPIFGGIRANHEIPVLKFSKIPSISGLYVFSYAGHIVFPNLYKAMKDPSKFTKVCIISFTTVTLLYTTLAFLGAKLFGPDVNPQITLSMPRHMLITKIAMWATVLTPMTKYALEFTPFAMQLEQILPQSFQARTRSLVRGTIGSLLLLLILALALAIPYFEHVLSLTGSLVSVFICAILPCAFHTKIHWPRISRPRLALNVAVIGISFVLGVCGTFSSSKMLIKTLKAAHSASVNE